ncbi:hypothetical protein B4Q13_21585, partial [Lacticaseibacillus rhamnosus]
DLVVTKVSRTPRALVVGHTLMVQARVANRGDGKARRSRLGLYLSPTSYWSSSAVALTGSGRIRPLKGHRSAVLKARLRVPRRAPPGRRYPPTSGAAAHRRMRPLQPQRRALRASGDRPRRVQAGQRLVRTFSRR